MARLRGGALGVVVIYDSVCVDQLAMNTNWMFLAAWLVFGASYTVFAFGRLPGTKLDRTAAAVIGGVLMFAFRILSPSKGIAAVDFATIVLLFAMMVIVAGLHLSGFFDRVAVVIAEKMDADHLLPGVIFTSGLLSAFLVNDVVCLFMAPLLLRVSKTLRRPAFPLLMALATASNIGSVATITGNPQNILIGSLSGISYTHFLWRLGPPALIGLFIDWAILHWFFGRQVESGTRVENLDRAISADSGLLRWPLLVTALVLVGFFAGIAPPLVAAMGAAMMLLSKRLDRTRMFGEVDWSLLVLFVGLFLIVGGAEEAGITRELLGVMERMNLRNPLALTLAVTGLSNVVSNVPAVMLLKNLPMQMADPQKTWLLLALTSTLAGNLTITGSVANIIVVEKARAEAPVSFWQYAKVGVPVTLATMVVGVAWLLLI
jgi:Na+/H+ antiporter NhaD/arsenite permease-like protein